MVFGSSKVWRRLHFFATLMVALGTLFSAFWILSVNSWMQTPAGYGMNEHGQFIPIDWWKVIFNPSFPYRLVHMVIACYLSTALVVGAAGAFHLLRDRDNRPAPVMFSMALWLSARVAPLQLTAGDLHGLNTLEYQPAKVAAMEGHFESGRGLPLYLFGIPDMQAETMRSAIAIPKLGSLILTHDPEGAIKGLKDFPRENWPNVTILFWSFRLMVGLGLLMIAMGLWSLVQRARGRLYDARWLMRMMVVMGPMG